MTEETKIETDVSIDMYVYSEPYSRIWEEAWKVSLAVIKKMSEELKARNAAFLVITITDNDAQIDGTLQRSLENKTKGQKTKWDIEKPLKILDRFCKEQGINFLPLLYDFRKEHERTKEKFHFIHDGHWNKRGHELAAEIIYRRLTDDKIINSIVGK
jgi:hypothetical protein